MFVPQLLGPKKPVFQAPYNVSYTMEQISHAELRLDSYLVFIVRLFFFSILKRCLFLPLECTDTALHRRPSIMAVPRSARTYSYEAKD
jgi:hypothetical protein